MPKCCAFGCTYKSKSNCKRSIISLHSFPKDGNLRRKWINAARCARLPDDPRLCSQHFHPENFDNSIHLHHKLLTHSRLKRKLKDNAIPTIFSFTPNKKPRIQSELRASRRQRQQTIEEALASVREVTVDLPKLENKHIQPEVPEESRREASTQTDVVSLPELVSIGVQVEELPVITHDYSTQFPQDASVDVIKDHSYASGVGCQLQARTGTASESESLNENSVPCVDNFGPDAEQEVVEFCCSQTSEKTTSFASQSESEYCFNGSQDELSQSQSSLQSLGNSDDIESRVFLVYEEKLKELFRFCPNCGSPTVDAREVQNEGSQYSVYLTCLNGCSYKWQSQPPLCATKGKGNLALTAAIFFSGIHFAKYERFASCLNLKTLSESSYYVLRKMYVFPVVERVWEEEQASIFGDLLLRQNNVLVGDGRCDSPGHCAKYCTYTFMDIESHKVVDFKVISVSQVANSNGMEIKGFKDSLFSVESQGIKVTVISTDRHTQIRKEMRVNHPDKEHQFDPWHMAKSISKKLSQAASKTTCQELKPWIPSVINHFWWSATTCEGNSELLKEKWTSVVHHVTNRHEWPGNQFYHQCARDPYLPEAARKKKWLKPGSPAHQALVTVVKDKALLKDLAHLTKCVHTTILEVYHSMYLKHLPKQMHFTHEVMEKGTMLAALDHNKNVKRPQATIKDGDLKGEPKFKISWDKVTKRFGADPVPEEKTYNYLIDMVHESVNLAKFANQVNVADRKADRTHILAPEERPARQEIIQKRLEMSRY